MATLVCPACSAEFSSSARAPQVIKCPHCQCRLAAPDTAPAAPIRPAPHEDDESTASSALDRWQASQNMRRRRRNTLLVAVGIVSALAVSLVAVVVLGRYSAKDKPATHVASGNPSAKSEPRPQSRPDAQPAEDLPPKAAPRVREENEDDTDLSKLRDNRGQHAPAPVGPPAPQLDEPPQKRKSDERPVESKPAARPDPAPAKDAKSAEEAEATARKRVDELSREALGGATKDIRIKAIEELGRLGPKAKPASRALCEALLDRSVDVARAAADAIAVVNPLIHEPVIRLKVDAQYANRIQAVRDLANLQKDGAPAVPVLLRFMSDYLHSGRAKSPNGIPPYDANQDAALVVTTLMDIAPDDPAVGKQVQWWLAKDSNPFVRAVCAAAITRRDHAKTAVSPLLSRLRVEPDANVRVAIVNALGGLKGDAKVAERALRDRKSNDTSTAVREAASRALDQIGVAN